MIIQPRLIGNSPSTLPHLRRTNAKLSQAMSAVPNLDATIAMLDDLTEGAKPIVAASLVADVTARVHASLADGKGVPADMLTRYAEASAAERAFVIAGDALNELAGLLLQDRDNLIRGGLPTMCSTLNDELQRVYSELRALASAPKSADDAIAQGKVAQYKTMSALRSEYAQIREAQRHLLTSGLRRADEDQRQFLIKGWPIIAHAANLGAIWPDLPEWHKYGKKLGPGGQHVKLTPPWPDPDSEAFLDWLIMNPDAGPWVPTFDQATELLNEIVRSAQTLYETNRSPDQEALAREYDRRKRMWGQPTHVVN